MTLGTHELAPGQMAVDVIAHPVSGRPCWSFVSRGLAALGQREIVMTLSAGPGDVADRPPTDPLAYFNTVYQLARQGSLVDESGFTGFGGEGMLGAMGVAYGAAVALDGIAVPPDALVALLLSAAESRQANSIGTTRVLTRLGGAYRFYPHPFWSDRGRHPVAFDGEGSLLESVAVARVPGAYASVNQTIVTLRLPRSAVSILAGLDKIPATAGFAITCGIDRAAAGHLVWHPGQPAPAAIRASGGPDTSVAANKATNLAGSFVMFAPQHASCSGQIAEDGFAFLLTDDDWLRVRKALMAGRRVSIPAAPGALSLSLEWRRD